MSLRARCSRRRRQDESAHGGALEHGGIVAAACVRIVHVTGHGDLLRLESILTSRSSIGSDLHIRSILIHKNI
jgi:hypothetical protein